MLKSRRRYIDIQWPKSLDQRAHSPVNTDFQTQRVDLMSQSFDPFGKFYRVRDLLFCVGVTIQQSPAILWLCEHAVAK